jgi:hypothetical protein
MGSLQRSSSLGRAGESSLQTAARKYLEREQKLKNSPYGRPLLKSRSDPAAIRKQRYSTSASEIGSGVARQQHSRGNRRSDAEAAASKKHRQRLADAAFARQLVLNEGEEEEAALKRDEALARELAKRDMTPPGDDEGRELAKRDAARGLTPPASRELTPPRASDKALSLARRADVLRPKSARRRTRTPSPPPEKLRDKLVERLRDFGLQEFDVAGDGNCQYRALAHQLFDNVELHADVRRTVCRQLAAEADRYRGFVATEDDVDFEAWAARMACAGEWGDHVTLQAAADAYGTRICLVTSYEDRGILRVEPAEPIEGEEPRTAWLAFWAEIHYSSIVPMGEAAEEVPA